VTHDRHVVDKYVQLHGSAGTVRRRVGKGKSQGVGTKMRSPTRRTACGMQFALFDARLGRGGRAREGVAQVSEERRKPGRRKGG
jgi:hypothetical protein